MRRLVQHFFKPGDLPGGFAAFERFAERRSGRTGSSLFEVPPPVPFRHGSGWAGLFVLHNSSNLPLKQIAMALLLACAVVVADACSKPTPQPASETTSGSRNVVDEAGRRVTIPVKIDRIISLAPNLTEIVYAIGAGNRLVGNTQYCDYPAEAKTSQRLATRCTRAWNASSLSSRK